MTVSGTGAVTHEELKALVRTVPDFPAQGILFRDITTLVAHPRALRQRSTGWPNSPRRYRCLPSPDRGARLHLRRALACRLGTGFIPVRKAGKLPVPTIGIDYALEYGEATGWRSTRR
jgi:adenine phosphoribosyltransferase